MKGDNGWLLIARKMTEWEWYTDANTMRVFLHLILTVNHRDKRWRGHEVPRGSRIASRLVLAEELKLSVKQVRTAIDKLISTGEVAKQSHSFFTLYKVNKYSEYQDYGQQEGQRRADEGPAEGRRGATTKQRNNETNKPPYPPTRGVKNPSVIYIDNIDL